MTLVLRWLVTAALAAATAGIVGTGRWAPHPPGVAAARRRGCDLAHTLLCTAMIAMIWPQAGSVPGWLRGATLGSVMAWFLGMALTAPGPVAAAPRSWRRRFTRWPGLANLHHAAMAATMTWMTVATPAPVMPGHTVDHQYAMPAGAQAHAAGMAGTAPGTAAALGAYFLLAALPWISVAGGPHRTPGLGGRRRGVHAAGNAAMSIAMGVLLIAGA
ncbi:MAG: hypothetical protein V7603_6620 [Micromonosporaceae bacterium]